MKERLVAQIDSDGPMPFDEFMRQCLYDPHGGFFTSGCVRAGEAADFVTSPEVSRWFGRLVGRWARDAAPSPDATLIEVGAGSGSLLEPMIDEVGTRPGSVFAVEVSPDARRAIGERAPEVIVVSRLEDLPQGHDIVVVVNELLDNLPVRLVERIGQQWAELVVVSLDGALILEHRHVNEHLSGWCDEMLGRVPEGALMTAQVGVDSWIRSLLSSSESVRACVIDYAGTTAELAGRPRADVVRTYHGQRSGFDFLDRPGATDITVDVNIDVVRRAVAAAGGTVEVTDQRSFLMDLGAGDVLVELADREHELARTGDVMGQLTARSEATNLRALLDPGGFGGFSVFLIESGT